MIDFIFNLICIPGEILMEWEEVNFLAPDYALVSGIKIYHPHRHD